MNDWVRDFRHRLHMCYITLFFTHKLNSDVLIGAHALRCSIGLVNRHHPGFNISSSSKKMGEQYSQVIAAWMITCDQQIESPPLDQPCSAYDRHRKKDSVLFRSRVNIRFCFVVSCSVCWSFAYTLRSTVPHSLNYAKCWNYIILTNWGKLIESFFMVSLALRSGGTIANEVLPRRGYC